MRQVLVSKLITLSIKKHYNLQHYTSLQTNLQNVLS